MLFVFSDFLEAFAKDKNLTLTDRRVLCYLLATMDLQNLLQTTQKEIAHQLEIPRPNLSTSLIRLAEWGYIQIQKEGNLNIYQINQNSALKCRTEKKNTPFLLKDSQDSQDSQSLKPTKQPIEKKKDTSITSAFNKIFPKGP